MDHCKFFYYIYIKIGETTYYKKNREKIFNRAKYYYENNKEVLREKTKNKYIESSEEKIFLVKQYISSFLILWFE